MALEENGNSNGMVMPVQPMGYGGYGNYGGYGGGYAYPVMPVQPMGYGGYGGGFGNMFGGDGAWIILLLLLCGGGWGGMGGFGGMGGMNMFPWILASNANNQNATNAGFDNIGLTTALSGIQSSITSGNGDTQLGLAGLSRQVCETGGDIQQSLCSGFAGTTSAVTNAQNAISQQMYQNEIASLNRSFAEQTANSQGLNAVQARLADCCCKQDANTESLRYTIATENCADRAALSDGVRDILTATQAQNQRILDKLCDQELQAERRENAELRTRLNMADLAASQAAQTAALVADNTAQTQYIVNRVAPYPIPAYPVSNPYGCNGYNGYGGNWGGNWGGNPFGNVGFGNGSF